MKINISSLLAATFYIATSLAAQTSSATQPANSYTKQQVLDIVNQIAADSPYMPKKLSSLLEEINESKPEELEGKLEKAITTLLAIKIKPEQRAQLEQIQAMLVKKLQNFKVSGASFAADFNGGFIVDTQDPRFTVTYKDAAGNTKTRTYQADISLVGLNIELALRLNLIFFVGTDFNFHESNKVIELGKGIQVSPFSVLSPFFDFLSPVSPFLPILDIAMAERVAHEPDLKDLDGAKIGRIIMAFTGHKNFANNLVLQGGLPLIDVLMYLLSHLNLTYIPFNNTPGGMIIVGAVVGYDNINLSMVTGGTLTPVVDAA